MNIYESMPTLLDKITNPKSQAVGVLGEYFAMLRFRSAGYLVDNPHRDHRGDLVVIDQKTGIVSKVEVKTARKSKNGRWLFLLYKKGRTDYRDSDFVLLQAVLRNGDVVSYLIPRDDLGERSIIVLSSHPANYRGQWAKYRQNRRLNLGVIYGQ